MLEISHLTKIYKSKKGATVKALDDISLKFPETGMVFLLGKSGSGKSTLLNVCGGLDEPTSGEIIVKGRSGKNFSGSDFDSYRNTFIGFIFQEYNILNEFTVEENIALAIELQNKKVDKQEIENLLEKVDLKGYAKRKPNTLSGGQKQRIAIARALIKHPEIIMADEPTGALDSVTGTQVLDTLKKLSKDTLVIIVSHDREFAENYADRIIELKDGKVISDVSKQKETEEIISSNLKIVGNTISIKKGSDLTNNELETIKEFIQNTDTNIILSKDQNEIKSLRESLGLTENRIKKSFKETIESNIELKNYTKADSEFIRSRLPLKHAFRIGSSTLKHKPFRLALTILLCTVAFIMFGILSTMLFYDNESTFKDTLKNSSYSYLKINKEFKSKETMYEFGEESWSYERTNQTAFYENDYDNIKSEYGKDIFYGVNTNIKFGVQNQLTPYYLNEINTFAYLEEDNSLYSSIIGKYPTKDNEICISSYIAEVMFVNKIFDLKTNKILELKSKEELIGKSIVLDNRTYIISGIFDSEKIDSKYDELKEYSENRKLINEYTSMIYDELHQVAFITKNHLDLIAEENLISTGSTPYDYHNLSVMIKQNEYPKDNWYNSMYGEFKEKHKSSFISLNGKTLPADNEVVISRSMFAELMTKYYNEKLYNDYDEKISKIYDLALNILHEGIYNDKGDFSKYTEKELVNKTNELINAYKKENRVLNIGYKLQKPDGTDLSGVSEAEVIGIVNTKLTPNMSSIILFSQTQTNNLWNVQKNNIDYYEQKTSKYEQQETAYHTIYIPFKNTKEEIDKMWTLYNPKFKGDNSRIGLSSNVVSNLIFVDEMVSSLSKVFLYAGIGFALFSILLFSNFISISIINKRKEIGILRAVGARSMDVFRIFSTESFIITIICIITSSISCILICKLLNDYLSIGVGVSLFVFGIVSFLVLSLVAFLTAFIATLLPVYKAAKKKPVESIRAI